MQRSTILQHLNAALPPSSGLIEALARLDPFPRIDGPEARVPAPTRAIARAAGVEAAAGSVVKILGNACGLGVEGSGWVAGRELVVTNAHVVAGQKDTRVLLRGRQPGLDARAVAFDSRNDLAVLRVPGLEAAALTLASDPRIRHLGGDPRLPRQRPLRRARGPRRRHPRGDHAGRVRPRAGAALDHVTARCGALRQLRRADGRQGRPGGDDDLRGHHQRAARRLRRAQLDRRPPAPASAPRGVSGRLVRLGPCTGERYPPAREWGRHSSSPRSRPSAGT